MSIAEMYRIRHDAAYAWATNHADLRKKYRVRGYGMALSLDERGRLVKNRIVDIRLVGQRPVSRVTLASRKTIDCTAEHNFPTRDGERRMEQLAAGDQARMRKSARADAVDTLPEDLQRGHHSQPIRGRPTLSATGRDTAWL